jgi:hypothetical protein
MSKRTRVRKTASDLVVAMRDPMCVLYVCVEGIELLAGAVDWVHAGQAEAAEVRVHGIDRVSLVVFEDAALDELLGDLLQRQSVS